MEGTIKAGIGNIDEALALRKVTIEISEYDLNRIPKASPFIIVVNRFEPEIDELLLIKIFADRFPDFKILSDRVADISQQFPANSYAANFNFSILQKPVYFFEIFLKILGKAKKNQSCLAVVIDFSGSRLEAIAKNQQVRTMLKAVHRAGLPVLPVRIDAPDKKNPFMRLLRQGEEEVFKAVVRIGSLISVEDQEQMGKRYWKFIRSKIFALGTGLEVKKFFQFSFRKKPEVQEPLLEPVSPELIEKEILQLTFGNLITSQASYDIFVASAKQIPHTLMEIGRLREVTFRGVGEGTGKSHDLDEFDLYYLQLIIWDREEKKIVGGYRMGKGDKIFMEYGVEGFYISSLFKIEEGFYPIMQKAIELGRSYIVEEYQKKRLPLFLLWRGILFFLLKNPQYRYLYGPVSISKHYSSVSKSLIVEFIKRYFFDQELAKHLKPRKPFKIRTEKVDIDLLLKNIPAELNALDNFVEDIEPDHFRLPVLIKQYVKQNAKFISFNVDPNFSDVLDGFMILDLNDVPVSTIEALKKEGVTESSKKTPGDQ